MDNIRRNENVRHIGDVHNLITSVIFRQNQMFSTEEIYEEVEKNLERSEFDENGARRNEINVRSMVDDTINTLFIIDCIRYDSKQHKYELCASFPAVNKR